MKGYYNGCTNECFTPQVVEGLILKGYYNFIKKINDTLSVVEGLILKGYYNCKMLWDVFGVL